MTTCEIQWVDKHGEPTPDNAPAIGYVRREAYVEQILGRGFAMPVTEWFPICAFHKHRLTEPGMEHWTFKPLEAEPQE